MASDGYYIYQDYHLVSYKVQSLGYIPKTKIILYVNSSGKKIKNKKAKPTTKSNQTYEESQFHGRKDPR